MKMSNVLIALSLTFGLLSNASAILITDVGINITNDGTVLVPDVPQATLPNQSPAAHFAWLLVLVPDFNTIEGASLPDPIGPVILEIQDDDASNNGNYSLVGGMSYYIVSHYGQANTAWYLSSADGNVTYGMPSPASVFGGAGRGLSNIRIWRVNGTTSMPDGGATVALLGVALVVISGLKKKLDGKKRS